MKTDRLSLLASLVRQGAIAADIGTDHGKLALLLIQNGIAEYVYATDINRLPLEKAVRAIRANHLENRIETVLTDGLKGLDDKPLTDIVIAGMGGETIAGIIEKSAFLKEGVRFILQPMTRAAFLRTKLASLSFFFEEERLISDKNRIYPVFRVGFDGKTRELSPAEAILGIENVRKEADRELFTLYAEKKLREVESIYEGQKKAGLDTGESEKVLSSLRRTLKKDETFRTL